MKQFVSQYLGKNIYFENCSYNCPFLKLYGYKTERAIKAAIKKALKC